jgi:hypothetical protein
MARAPTRRAGLLRGGPRQRKTRLPVGLALLQGLVLSVVALFVATGIGLTARGDASLSLAIDAVVASETACVERVVQPAVDPPMRSGFQWDAVECDDDDDDPLCHTPQTGTLAFREVFPPHGRARLVRAEPLADPSRFAVGSGLPRGPPAA